MNDPDLEPLHPIGVVAERTGLTTHVLRAWERRYGVVQPSRPQGGPRLYSNADILHFRLLRRLTNAGHGIGRIAALSVPELMKLLPPERRESFDGAASVSRTAGERFVAEALEALEGMDARNVRAALTHAVVALSAQGFIEGVALPLLHRVGELWADGAICPAHEHLLSVQIARVLGSLADTIPLPDDPPVAVAATPAGQRHEFGALLASVVAAEEGWEVAYLGPDLPAVDIAAAVEARNASVLLLSAVTGTDVGAATSEVREICALLPAHVRILLGGSAAERAAKAVRRPTLSWLPDLHTLRVSLREMGEVT